jgi:hypothetical protein
LVTTIVQVTTPPTSTGSGVQFLVTSTLGWNRFVLAFAVAVSELAPLTEHPRVAEVRSGVGLLGGGLLLGLARGLSREQAGLVWDRVLAVHGPHLSHAIVDVDSGAWLTAEELPAEVKTAASRLRQLAADAQRGASWYQRTRTRGLVSLDLGHPEELELLRRYGPFTTDARVWVHGDPNPVVETGDTFGDLPRFTYRLDQAEVEQVRTLLAEAGLTGSTLVPRRLRAAKT